MQVWKISIRKAETPFFLATPLHTTPGSATFSHLQDELDHRFGTSLNLHAKADLATMEHCLSGLKVHAPATAHIPQGLFATAPSPSV